MALAISGGPVVIAELAEKEQLPEDQVNRILEQLRKKHAVTLVSPDSVEITEEGQEMAWEIVDSS